MSRLPYASKSTNDDRFIPRRIYRNTDPLRPDKLQISFSIESIGDFNNIGLRRYYLTNYGRLLRNAMIPSSSSRVLRFSLSNKISSEIPEAKCSWPVKNSRKKPVINIPMIILDMPGMDFNLMSNKIDWSAQDFVATIFNDEIHMWYAKVDKKEDDNSFREVTDTSKRVQTFVKWNKSGNLLAFGEKPRYLRVMDKKRKEFSNLVICCKSACRIISVEWLSDDSLISGCTKGVLMYCDFTTGKFVTHQLHSHSVIKIAASCGGKFVATSDLNGNVKVWKMPNFNRVIQENVSKATKILAWHPWKESLLAIGDKKISLWDVCLKKEVTVIEDDMINCFTIDALSFNPISGEMVVSLFVENSVHDADFSHANIILVFSNDQYLTEIFHYHVDRVPYLLWGNKGRSLGTVGCDENLAIWDFFGPPNAKKKKNVKASSILTRECIR